MRRPERLGRGEAVAAGSPRPRVITDADTTQQRLRDVFNLSAFAPSR